MVEVEKVEVVIRIKETKDGLERRGDIDWINQHDVCGGGAGYNDDDNDDDDDDKNNDC